MAQKQIYKDIPFAVEEGKDHRLGNTIYTATVYWKGKQPGMGNMELTPLRDRASAVQAAKNHIRKTLQRVSRRSTRALVREIARAIHAEMKDKDFATKAQDPAILAEKGGRLVGQLFAVRRQMDRLVGPLRSIDRDGAQRVKTELARIAEAEKKIGGVFEDLDPD